MIDIYTVGGQQKPSSNLGGWQSVDIADVICSQEITTRSRVAERSVGRQKSYRNAAFGSAEAVFYDPVRMFTQTLSDVDEPLV